MPSVTKLYDLALQTLLYTKFASILNIDTQSSTQEDNINKGIVQCPKEIAQRAVAEKRGENFLEFINFWRVGSSPSWSRQRTPLARRGLWLGKVEDELSTIHVKAQPIDLNYNVWFWSKDLDKVYQCIEEYIFWQQDYPKIGILFDDKWEITPDLHFGEMVDESTVPEQYSTGLIYCFKMPIKIDGWVLKYPEHPLKTITKIVLKMYDKDDVEDYTEIIVEDSNQNVDLEAILRMFKKTLYAILSIDSPLDEIIIPNDRVGDFSANDIIQIENSTANDGRYTVLSTSLVDSNTKIVVAELLKSTVANGNIYKRDD